VGFDGEEEQEELGMDASGACLPVPLTPTGPKGPGPPAVGASPEPRHHFGEQGKITRLVVSSRRGQALPDGGSLPARDTPPLHSGPTARQPHRGAARRQPATPPIHEAAVDLRRRATKRRPSNGRTAPTHRAADQH
jgi:hypothetical protein